MPEIDPKLIAAIRRNLFRWYRAHARVLPWRVPPGSNRQPNPYHVLVSEAMLQQTQVATVIDYFNRFVATFPTVEDLAAADEQLVLRHWQGLGYYRRARHLHAAAKKIVTEFDSQVPADVPALKTLPGVGPYSAGAIASIAHNTPAPLVDGNVIRILTRIFNIARPADHKPVQQQIWSLAEQLVPQQNAGDFNQAMMELGAMICSPKSASCAICPVRNQCQARKVSQDHALTLPVMGPKKKPRPVTHQIFAISRHGKFLFLQRPANGLWSNMYQLPTLEHDKQLLKQSDFKKDQSLSSVQAAPIKKHLKRSLNLTAESIAFVKSFKHQTTHLTIHFDLFLFMKVGGRVCAPGQKLAWRELNQLADLPLSKPQQKAVQLLLKRLSS